MRGLNVYCCPTCGHYGFFQLVANAVCPHCSIAMTPLPIPYQDFMDLDYPQRQILISRHMINAASHLDSKAKPIEMLLNGRDRVHHRAEKGVMIPYQPTGEDMDFIRTQDYIHTDLSWNVTGLLKDMRSKGTKIYFDFSKRYQHEDVPTILKNINYGIFSFEEETEEVRELLRMGCSMGAEVLLATFGEGGSLAFDGTEFYRQPCIPAPKLVNTVGAGDSYGAGFMSGVLRGRSIPECMLSGAKKAAEIVSIFEPYHV